MIECGIGFFFWMVVARFYPPYEVDLVTTIIPVVVFLGMFSRFQSLSAIISGGQN